MSHGPPLDAAETSELDAHLARRGMRIRAVRDIFEIIAFSAAGIWALWTFWYQASYEPAHEQAHVEWSLSLEREGVRPSDGMLAIRAHTRGVNKGKASQHLVSMSVDISGGHVARGGDAGREPLLPDARGWDHERGVERRGEVVLASQGNRWGGGYSSTVDPDQESATEFLFWIDPADYDYLSGTLIVHWSAEEKFDRSWYETRLNDAGAVEVTTTEACHEARPHCTSAATQTGVDLPLWPGTSTSAVSSPTSDWHDAGTR